jgi:phosphoglycerate dehydrogenase-like enzyme
MVSLEEMFSRCAVVSNHLANNAQTRGMLNYELFSKMEPHATFINTGRGAQVVEADLVRALTEVPTRVAVLDVTDPEPPLADSPFYTMENVILTSHIAGSQQDEFHRMSEYMRDEAYAFEQGLPTRYSVTLKMLETMA